MAEQADLIWIQDAAEEYSRSRPWLYDQINAGVLSTVTIPGDRKVYLLRSELDKLIQPRVQRKERRDEGTA